jgi:hypothetical protein
LADSLSTFLQEPGVRTARKLLVAPSQQAGVSVRTALARAGIGIAGLEVSTPLGLARRIVESADAGTGGDVLGPSTLAVQVACILHAMEEREGRPLMRSAGTIARSIAESRSAGIDVARYGRLVSRDIGRIAVEAFRTLDRDIARSGRRDAALLLADAARLAGSVPADGLPEILLVLDAVDLAGSAVRLLEAVRDRVPQAVRVDVPVPGGWAPPFAAASRLDWPTVTLEAAAAPVRFVEAVGVESEARSVVRLIAEQGLRLDEVEIVYPSHDPYLAVMREVFAATDLEATWAAGIPATDTRPGQAVRAFLRWMADGLPSAGLLGMLRTGSVVLPADDGRRSLARAVASRLGAVRVGHGTDGYRAALGADFEPLEPLFGLVPVSDIVSPADLAGAAALFVERFAPPHAGEESDRVTDEIATRLRELGQAEGRAPLRRLASRFEAVLLEVFVQARAARPGAVHVAPLSGAGHTGRPHLVVVGLDQGAFGSSRAEDSIIPDERRRDADDTGAPLLPESTALRERPRWWLARAMARACGSVTLVRSTYDFSNDGEQYPSTAWLELHEEQGHPEPQVHALRPRAVGGAAGRAASLTEVLLATRHDPSTHRHVALLRPSFERGDRAQEAAASAEWTAHDGVVSVARDPWSATRPVSPTRLEDLAACPFRYFLRFELGVEPPLTRDEETWMEPRELGTLVHSAFEAYVRAWITDGRPGTPESLRGLLETGLRDFIRVSEPPSAAVEQRVRRDLEAAARVLLHDVEEARTEGRTPVGAEFAFGGARPGRDGRRTEPYSLHLDGFSVSLRGIVDRLDRLPDGRLVVIDYKTGSAYGFTGRSLGEDGTKLQWALYALAVEDLLGQPVERSGYLFVGGRELGLVLFLAAPDRSELADRLREQAALPLLGMFPQAAGSDACTFCDFARVCGDLQARKEQIESKVAATPDDSDRGAALQGWKRRAKKSK